MSIELDVEILKKEVADMKSIHVRLDSAIDKISDVTNSINRMLAVHEQKLSSQEEEILSAHEIVEARRIEFHNEIKSLHERITTNNKELLKLMSEQHMDQTQQLNNLKSELTGRVAMFDKFRWLLIGGSIVVGFILHKAVNFSLLIS